MSPVSSVESWFFSSFGWKVPMPMRSFSERTTRRQRMWLAITFDSHPRNCVISVLQDEAAGGIEIPIDADLELSLPSPSSRIALVTPVGRDESKRLLVHRAREPLDVLCL